VSTAHDLENFLSGAPRDPGPIAPDLLGWMREDGLAVCAHCAGRIMARGFGTAFRGWTARFRPETFPGCALVQAVTARERTAKTVVSATLLQKRRGETWSLELECGHHVRRPARGPNPKPPKRVNACEKCFTAEVWASYRKELREDNDAAG
jgi:hypothetical protein